MCKSGFLLLWGKGDGEASEHGAEGVLGPLVRIARGWRCKKRLKFACRVQAFELRAIKGQEAERGKPTTKESTLSPSTTLSSPTPNIDQDQESKPPRNHGWEDVRGELELRHCSAQRQSSTHRPLLNRAWVVNTVSVAQERMGVGSRQQKR